jgi:hypothetical protein
MNIQWDVVERLVHFMGWIVLYIWTVKLLMLMISTVFVKFCHHCKRKV